jgi:hypothetical protein
MASDGINMFNFRYEDGFKINTGTVIHTFRKFLSIEIISRPPQSHVTIPLKKTFFGNNGLMRKLLIFKLLLQGLN